MQWRAGARPATAAACCALCKKSTPSSRRPITSCDAQCRGCSAKRPDARQLVKLKAIYELLEEPDRQVQGRGNAEVRGDGVALNRPMTTALWLLAGLLMLAVACGTVLPALPGVP